MMNETLNKIKQFFDTNKTKDADFRLEQLQNLKNAVLNYQVEIKEALYRDLHKPPFEVYSTEIGMIVDELDNAIKNLKLWMRNDETAVGEFLEPSKSIIVKEPYGTVLIIVPFNYPFQLTLVPLIGAIAAGNCAVIRTSKKTPETTKVLYKIISETFDENYVKMFPPETISTQELLENNFDYIFFTGSTNTGRKIAQKAGEKLIPYTLELGGKSPVIVDENADIEKAAKRIIKGKLMNAGQTCIAPDYLLAHSNIKNKLIEELKLTIRKFYGSDAQYSSDYGRIIDTEAFVRLDKIIKEENSKIIYGGKTDECGLYIEPTIIDNCDFNSFVMQEEIFGPILPIIEWNNKDEVISNVRKLNKPLALYVFSKDEDFIKKVVKSLSFGGGCINDTMNHIASVLVPFGGVGASGIGHYHGKYSFDTFTHLKTILINKQDEMKDIFIPPFDEEKLEYIKRIWA